MDRIDTDKTAPYMSRLINALWEAINSHFFNEGDPRAALDSSLDELYFTRGIYSPEIEAWIEKGMDLICQDTTWIKEGEKFLWQLMSQRDNKTSLPREPSHWLSEYLRDEAKDCGI